MNGMNFQIQFLVTSELDDKKHIWIKSLTRTMNRNYAQQFFENCSKLVSEDDRKNLNSVINVVSEANIELFKKIIQGGDKMCEELKEMLAPEIMEFKLLLADKDAKLADKDAKLADKDAKLMDKDAKLMDKDNEIARLRKMLTDAGIKP